MEHPAQSAENRLPPLRSRPLAATLIIVLGLAALVLCLGLSVSVGAASIKLTTVWEAVFRFNGDLTSHQIIRELRLPRALAGALVGAAFATAGAIMQGMTRNPLADPGLLGINAGAGLALALCFAFYPSLSFNGLIGFSFIGAALGAALVFGIGSASRGGLTPAKLALAGATVMALLNSLSEAISIHFRIGQQLAFWYAGGMAGIKWSQLAYMAPWIVVGLFGAIALSRSITLLSLGEETAAGLGVRTGLVKLLAVVVVLVLAGSSVAAVGSIGFVGLVIPHISRFLVGVNYKWIIPCSAVLGSLLIVLADIAARMINPPSETPVGALIALIGVPFFLYLVRRVRREM
ncbi:FecCD family ABC transporter permease [Cohnella zeiphila]|uniref:Iron ABC transporter permease n=1 Tax=Cohnella zeiphila TaxID=2761120 RepID=A0A7X0SKQ7_9BACL|nr:iron ABC transporter permease [Cohnella zeiphila]MBB6730500.1 iron ABC transporter permease [Cohnella zeiphila]